MFALGLSTLALRNLLPERSVSFDPDEKGKKHRLSLYLLTIAGIVFRSEIALLLATHTIFLYFFKGLSIRNEIIPAGVSGVLIGLLLTVSIDSFFWRQFPLWPELSGFIFNVVGGGADAWGIQPWHFYFTNSLPRLLMNPLTYTICIPISLLQPSLRPTSLSILTPIVAYISLYSLVPHKEYRFIIYTLPPITTVAALGASYIWTHRTKSLLYRLFTLLLILSTITTLAISTLLLLPLSSLNYPGAAALSRLHQLVPSSSPPSAPISVHLDVLSCQTGITRFQQNPPAIPLGPATPEIILPGDESRGIPTLRAGGKRRYKPGWLYNKTDEPDELLKPEFWSQFDYVLTEAPERVIGSWDVLDHVKGFAGVRLLRPGQALEVDPEQSLLLENGVGVGGLESEHHLSDPDVEQRFLSLFLGDRLAERIWAFLETQVRTVLLRGWWVRVRMEPKIWILKRAKKEVVT